MYAPYVCGRVTLSREIENNSSNGISADMGGEIEKLKSECKKQKGGNGTVS